MRGTIVTENLARETGMHEQGVLESAIRDFKRSVEITRDVRFQANIRLARRQRASSYIVSLLSLYVIALSLIPNILDLNRTQSQILLACSIVLSVFVIFTSLIDGAQNFFHQGELLHQCARRVATIHHELKTIDVTPDPINAKKELHSLQEQYKKALDECPVNHDNVDFLREVADKPHLFRDKYGQNCADPIKRSWYRLLSVVLGWSWMAMPMAAFFVVSYFVYQFILLTPGGAAK